MMVYAEREERIGTWALLDEICKIADSAERAIRFGQLEAGVVDALCLEADDSTPVTEALRRAAFSRDYESVRALPLPEVITIRPQEGFAYYALDPAMYCDAVSRFLTDLRPECCVVAGIRSIGTALSIIVEQTVARKGCPVWSFTVRPRGHPFHRQVGLMPGLAQKLRTQTEAFFLVVDEGPGLSGSSFASVAEALNSLGIRDSRIIFFPGHQPDLDALNSPAARVRWMRHRHYVEPFCAERYVPPGARDLSGGMWRQILPATSVAVHRHHERRKYLHHGVLWKFEGLGHYGRALEDRARVLGEAGFSTPPEGREKGFLLTPWVEGAPASKADDTLLDRIAMYLAFLADRFPSGETVRTEDLLKMIYANTGKELAKPPSETVVAVDGRMLPHEWIETKSGWIKTDALHHHNDHFFPGSQDIAWDIAGTAVEFDVNPEVVARRYLRIRPDRTLHTRLPFYRLAYLAWRIGYATMAAETLGSTEDGLRFRALARSYTAAFELACTLPASSVA